MKKIILTFLGTGNYTPCQYSYQEFTSTEQTYFSVALAEYLKPEAIFTLATPEADKKHGVCMHNAITDLGVEHRTVPIPSGKTEQELWEIFTALTHNLPEACELHLDITHGFRSLPMIGMLALNYLRVTRDDLTIGGIHYGAYDPADASAGQTKFPIFDLTPFLTLLEWTSGAEQFKNTGFASLLGKQIIQTHQSAYQNRKTNTSLPTKLKNLGNSLIESSQTLQLLRTGLFTDQAKSLQENKILAEPEADQFANPFMELIQPVTEQLTQFDSCDLSTLRDLIAWFIERGHTANALTLSREWLVSYIMVALGQNNHHTGHNERKQYERLLNILTPVTGAKIKPTDLDRHNETSLRQVFSDSEIEKIVSLYSKAGTARNDLNHAGFNEQNSSPDKIIRLAKDIASDISDLPLQQTPNHQ